MRCPTAFQEPLEHKILELKQKHPSWGAIRIRYQYRLPCHWKSVHNVIKRHGLLIKIKAKPQPKPKKFRRKHVDSMWQGDTFHLRISCVGRVYVTGFLDDCSNYRVFSGVYLRRSADELADALKHALAKKKGRRVPREMYLDNGKQFKAAAFRARAHKESHQVDLWQASQSQRQGQDRRDHKALYREARYSGLVQITDSLQEGTQRVRQKLEQLEKATRSWLEDVCISLQ